MNQQTNNTLQQVSPAAEEPVKKTNRDTRKPLKPGTIIHCTDPACDIEVRGVRGKGSSCITYSVLVKFRNNRPSEWIMKEFYPRHDRVNYQEKRDYGCHLMVKETDSLLKLKRRFEAAYEKQHELANHPETGRYIVEPYLLLNNENVGGVDIPLEYQDYTSFVLYQNDFATSLDHYPKMGAAEILRTGYTLSCALQKLHEEGHVLYMDIEPSNVLWINGTDWRNGDVKLFDFDAVLPIRGSSPALLHDIGIRGNEKRIQAQEIEELRKSSDLSKAGRKLVPAIDVHNTGAMLYKLLTGKEFTQEMVEAGPDAFEKELNKTEKVITRLLKNERRMLAEILYRALRNNPVREALGARRLTDLRTVKADPYPRYTSAAELAEGLAGLLKEAEAHSFVGDQYAALEWFRETAAVLDEYSPLDYQGDKEEVHVGIVGDHEIAKSFFRNMLGSMVLKNKKLHIHWAVSNPVKFLMDWIDQEPQMDLVLQFTELLVDGKEYPFRWKRVLNSTDKLQYTSEEFAVVHLDTLKQGCAEWFNDDQKTYPMWIAVADSDIKKNACHVEYLKDALKDQKALIAFGGAGKVRTTAKVKVVPFACEAAEVLKRAQTNIERKALAIHTMYCLDYDDKSANIRESFERPYDMKSSMSCALSIPYKLYSLGIKNDASAAKNYYDKVLNHPAELKEMMYLEHQRWSAFMMLEGYKCPSLQALKGYMYTNGNDHRNRNADYLFHPCLRAMDITNDHSARTPLDAIPRSGWLTVDLSPFDELDKMSLRIHRQCDAMVQELIHDKTMDKLLNDLEEQIRKDQKAEGYWRRQSTVDDDLKDFRNLIQNAMNGTLRSEALLYERLAYFERGNGELKLYESKYYERCQYLLKEIRNKLKVVSARNAYHDYKKSDDAIIRNIPLILDEGSIKEIRKPVTGVLFTDLYSTMVVRPERLVLIGAALSEVDRAIAVLRSRNIMTEVYHYTADDDSPAKSGVYLDLSGNDAETVYRYAMDGNRKYPLMAYSSEEDQLISLRKAENIRYRTILPKLMVEETIKLSGGSHLNMISGHAPDKMHDTYGDLMKIALEMDKQWEPFVTLFNKIVNQARTLELTKKNDLNPAEGKSSERIAVSLIENSNLEIFLQELTKNGILESYILPERRGQITLTSVKHSEEALNKLADWFVEHLSENSVRHRFAADEEYRTFMDETLGVFYTGTLTSGECKILKRGLEKIYAVKTASGEGKILDNLLDVTVIRDGDTVEVAFEAVDFATLSCLSKSGDILEAYTYHAVRRAVNVDDIKMNVIISWNEELSTLSDMASAVSNELDVIFTKDSRSYFISCKMQQVKTAHLMEIRYLTDRFGVNGTPILVTSRAVDNTGMNGVRKRAEEMGVKLISLPDYKSFDKLGSYIRNIVDRKEDWKKI